jgi:hypothetical protein
MPDLSDLQREAYARARPRHVILDTLQLDHPGLSVPLRFVANSNDDVSLPPAVGVSAVTFTPLAIEIVLPDMAVKEGPGEAKLRLCGVSAKLRGHIEELYGTGVAAIVTYREYEIPMVSGDPDFASVTGPTQIYDRLEMNVPRRTFDRDVFKALTAL